MARLDDLLPELKDDVSPSQIHFKSESGTPTGKKRRAWLVDNFEDKAITEKKRVVDHIHKPDFPLDSTRDGEDLKGSMNLVYKPCSLCFADLRSNPLQLFRFLFELAKKADDNYQTPRVKLREMMLNIDISKDSARTALRFLLKQKFIERIEFQPGSLGWSRYQLNKNIYKELERGLLKGSIDPFNEGRSRKAANLFTDELSDPWEEIDFSSLESIGFNKKHLLQFKKKTTPEIVQESINHFSYGLQYSKKTKDYSNPVATLITVLKRGEAWIEPNYQSAQEIAQLKILEIKKAELERKKAIEEELYKVAFEEWQQTLSKEEIDSLAPDNRKRGDMTPPHVKLSGYFKENIWPEKKKNFVTTEVKRSE